MGAIKREMNSPKWTAFALGYQCVFAYVIAFIVYQLGVLFTGGATSVVNIVGAIIAMVLVALIVFMLFKPYKESTKLTKKVKVK